MCGALGYIEVDHLQWDKVKTFMVVACCFVGLVFANMKVFAGIMLAYTLCESRLASTATTMQVLQYSNVETFVVFRASTPLLISLADYAFLGRELPSMRSVSHPLRAATETEIGHT